MKILPDEIFYPTVHVCAIIEFASRHYKLAHNELMQYITKPIIKWLYDNYDYNHTQPFEGLLVDIESEVSIPNGMYEIPIYTRNQKPSHVTIGKAYARIVQRILVNADNYQSPSSDTIANEIYNVFNSWLCHEISNFNSDLFSAPSEYLYLCYITGEPVPDD